MSETITMPVAAERLGVSYHQLRQLYRDGRLPPAPRAGLTRLIAVRDLPKIREKLIEAGYLEETAGTAA